MLDTNMNMNLLAILGPAVPPPAGLGQSSGGISGPRFDALLTELTRAAAESGKSTGKPIVSEDVKEALKSLLLTVSKKSSPQLVELAQNGAERKALAEQVVQEYGLNAEEKSTLEHLFQAALQRVALSPVTPVVDTGAQKREIPGTVPGPQGRTPVGAPRLTDSVAVVQVTQASETAKDTTQTKFVKVVENLEASRQAMPPAKPLLASGALGLKENDPLFSPSGGATGKAGGETGNGAAKETPAAANPAPGGVKPSLVELSTAAPQNPGSAAQPEAPRGVPSQGSVPPDPQGPVAPGAGGSPKAELFLNTAQVNVGGEGQLVIRQFSPVAKPVPAEGAGGEQAKIPQTPAPWPPQSGTLPLAGNWTVVDGAPLRETNVPVSVNVTHSQGSGTVAGSTQEINRGVPAPAMDGKPSAPVSGNTNVLPALPVERPTIVITGPQPQAAVDPSTVVTLGQKGAVPQAAPAQVAGQPAVPASNAGENAPVPAGNDDGTLVAPREGRGERVTPGQIPAVPVAVPQSRQQAPFGSVPFGAVKNGAEPAEGIPGEASSKAAGQGTALSAASFTAESIGDLANSVVKDFQLRETVLRQVSAQLDKLESGQSRLRIELEPRNLGKLEIALTTHEGRLIARLVASSVEVRDVIAANLQSFQDALSHKGILVQELSVAVRADVGGQSQGRAFDSQPWMFRQASGSSGDQEGPPANLGFAGISDGQARSSFSVLA